MKNMFIRTAALVAACIYMGSAAAQEPRRPEAQLRFDEARQEAIADLPSPLLRPIPWPPRVRSPINSTGGVRPKLRHTMR